MSARHLSEPELVAYADGDLRGAARQWADTHLPYCRSCSEAYEGLRGAVRRVLALPVVPPPADLRERVATKLALEPVRPLRCREARRLLQEVLDGCASPFAAGAVQGHLDGCSACRAEHVSLAEMTRGVRSLPQLISPARVWRAVQAGVRVPAPVSWGLRLRPAFAAVAVTAVAALVLFTRSEAPRTLRPIATAPQVASAPSRGQAEEIAQVRPPAVAATAAEHRTPAAGGSRYATALPEVRRERLRVASPTVMPAVHRYETARPTPVAPEPVRPAALPAGYAEVATAPVSGSLGKRVLAAVARVARYDIDPHTALASAGERIGIIDSEALAETPPTPAAGGTAVPGLESGAVEGTTDRAEDAGSVRRTA